MSLEPAAEQPCSQCPWLTANHGKPHPHKWYTLANRRRLWKGTRNGATMSCHPTDPNNEVPEGTKRAPDDAATRECTGLLILQQREVMRFDAACRKATAAREKNGLQRYRKAHPGGLLRPGILRIVERTLFGGVFGEAEMTKPDLDLPVSHDDLASWTEREGA